MLGEVPAGHLLGKSVGRPQIEPPDCGAYSEPAIYAPAFRRDLEEPIAGAIRVEPGVRLVITEGNYLLLDREGWREARRAIDTTWYLQPDDDLRIRRLIDRHRAFGKDDAVARAWATEIDEANARLVRDTRHRADAVVTVTAL